MLGQHDGIAPLADKDQAAGILLRALGRLKAGKDVPARRALIRRALEQITPDDRHWHETLVAQLSGENGIESIPAHGAALAAAWELSEDDVARHLRDTNTQQGAKDPFVKKAISGLVAAAPEFGKRLMAGRVDSDEVFIRVALAHLFQRDPSSTFQMFVIDGLVKNLYRATKLEVQDLTRASIERFSEVELPDFTWGYVVVIWEAMGRAGYFIPEPSEELVGDMHRLRGSLEGIMGPLDDLAFAHHAAASYVDGFWRTSQPEKFAAAIGPILQLIDTPYAVVHVQEQRDDEGNGGLASQIIPIPADNPKAARELVSKMGEVKTHDEIRRRLEAFAQLLDLASIKHDS